MTLSDLSIKNPVFAWMLMSAMILFGWIGLRGMGISQMPDVDFPVITVSVTWEGAAPEVVENEVTDVIEDAAMQVQGVRDLSSSSRQGSSSVTIEFDLDKDIDVALQEVQSKVAQAQRNLPEDVDPPVISKSNPEDQPILWIGVTSDRPMPEMMKFTRDYLKDQFTTVSGVGEVFLGGYVEPNLRLWLSAEKLQARELTVDDVINAVRSEHTESPAGFIESKETEMNVRVMGEADSVEEFGKIVIPRRSGQPIWSTIQIRDVAEVEDGLADVRRISRVNGKPAVGIGIRKQRGSNAVEVARKVKERMRDLQKILPKGYEMGVNFDRTVFIEQATHELLFTMILSAVLTSIVCWLFLGSFSSALNVILAIPTSIIGSFFVLYLFGFTLNSFTRLGLTHVIGIVVDDAIMVLENIVRHREMGESKVQAALLGAREITFAALAASVAILAIFIPVVFMKGIMGKYFFEFGITISVAVMLSLLEALTLAPMRCSQFLSVGHSNRLDAAVDRGMNSMSGLYQRGLDACLNHRWKIIFSTLLLFALSLGMARTLKKEFVPSQDQSRLMVRLQTVPGSSLAFTSEVFAKAEALIQGRPEVDRYFGAIGGFGGGEVNTGNIFITMKPKNEREVTQGELMNFIRQEFKKIPGVMRAVVQDLSQQGFTAQRGFPVEFSLRGRDWDGLARLSDEMRGKMEATGLMLDIDTDYRLGMPEVKIVPDRQRSAARGVSVSAIADTINSMIGGVRVGKYSQGGRRYDIRVRLVKEDRSRPEDIGKIWVRNNTGELIRLSDVVEFSERKTLLSISRKNRERAIGMFANVAPGKSQGEAIAAVQALGQTLPEGYRMVLSGSAQTFKESFSSLWIALFLGLVVAYMVLASQFNSFVHPWSVLLALPFSVTGAFLGLQAFGMTLNIYSMFGLILLMGIVKKNSILLVDFSNVRRKQGGGIRAALMEACPIRLRPIIMTSVSTIAAAIPPALALGPGAEIQRPMAVVVIGGVLVSTLLTLFVVPCAYSLMSRLEKVPVMTI